MSIDSTLKDMKKFLKWKRHQIIQDFQAANPKYREANLYFNGEDLLVDFKFLYDLEGEDEDEVEKLYQLQHDLNFEISY